jgi:hypothetical protein
MGVVFRLGVAIGHEIKQAGVCDFSLIDMLVKICHIAVVMVNGWLRSQF